MEHRGYDLYFPSSAAAQLGISVSFFRESVKKDPRAPVIVGRGMIACNTPALQQSWKDLTLNPESLDSVDRKTA
jgi:hypothetical protein